MSFKEIVKSIESTIERKLNDKEALGLKKTVDYRKDNDCFGSVIVNYDEAIFSLVVFDDEDYKIEYVG